jgi:hypothetical protein
MTSKTIVWVFVGTLFAIVGCTKEGQQVDKAKDGAAIAYPPATIAAYPAPTPVAIAPAPSRADVGTAEAHATSPLQIPTAVPTQAPTPKPESVPEVGRSEALRATAWIGEKCSGAGPRVYLHIVTQWNTLSMESGSLQVFHKPNLQVVGVYNADGEIRVTEDEDGRSILWKDAPGSPWHNIVGEYFTNQPYSAVFYAQIGPRLVGTYLLALTNKGEGKYLYGRFQDSRLGGFATFLPETKVVFTPIDSTENVNTLVREIASHSTACEQVN